MLPSTTGDALSAERSKSETSLSPFCNVASGLEVDEVNVQQTEVLNLVFFCYIFEPLGFRFSVYLQEPAALTLGSNIIDSCTIIILERS